MQGAPVSHSGFVSRVDRTVRTPFSLAEESAPTVFPAPELNTAPRTCILTTAESEPVKVKAFVAANFFERNPDHGTFSIAMLKQRTIIILAVTAFTISTALAQEQ